MTPKAPTIADVARVAGVSRAIASRALSSGARPVSQEKRERVLKAAEALNYRPNLLARSLTTKTVNLVAVLVNHIHDLSDLDLFDRLIERIQALGKQVILVRVGSVERVEEFLRDGVAFHVDAALVFSDFADAESVRRMFRSELVVMLNGLHDDRSPAVRQGDEGIAEAVRDAAQNGVRTAALVTGRISSRVEALRASAYRREFEANAIALAAEVPGDYSYASGYAAAERLGTAGDLGAVFCTSDAMAMGVLDAFRGDFPGSRPSRFRLYGFDNVSMTNFDAYPISSIGHDTAAYVETIIGFVESPDRFRPGDAPVSVPTRLIRRLTG